MRPRRSGLLVAGLILAVACYYLPWYTHATAGFTLHAFDLAEWCSLHPAVRSSSPPLLTSFLLRFPQLMLIAAAALAANQLADPRGRWILRGAALLLALRFVPPSDFFTGASADPNYRQMALLTVLSAAMVSVALLVAQLPARGQTILLLLTLAVGVAAGWWGLYRAGVLLEHFEIQVAVGPGALGLSLVSAGLGLLLVAPVRARPVIGPTVTVK